MTKLRDLLYLDLEKAASLLSQLAGGLRERVSLGSEDKSDSNAGLSVGIPRLLQAKLGASGTEKTSSLETKVLHHDLLLMLETELERLGFVTDANTVMMPKDDVDALREALVKTPYLKAHGQTVIEDYARIAEFAANFKKLAAFIATCAAQSKPDLQALLHQRENASAELERTKDKNARKRIEIQIATLERNISGVLAKELPSPDQWLLDGINFWIDLFMKNRLNLRVYPYPESPAFQILCNLKRDCFVDQDLEHLLFGYGNRPNVPLGVFGLITSMPSKSGEGFDPLNEFKNVEKLADAMNYEYSFRQVFEAMETMQALVRFSRYPNISIHPIAVFREFRTTGNL